MRGGRLVLATIASREPEGYFDDYSKAFADLDVGELVHLYVGERSEAGDRDKLAALDDAAGIFFTGGDQLRITSQIGDSGIEAKVRALHERGGVVAGTSAGASVISEIMLVRGTGAVSHRIGDLQMAAGLRLLRNVIIDQHFAERGRFGRWPGRSPTIRANSASASTRTPPLWSKATASPSSAAARSTSSTVRR